MNSHTAPVRNPFTQASGALMLEAGNSLACNPNREDTVEGMVVSAENFTRRQE